MLKIVQRAEISSGNLEREILMSKIYSAGRPVITDMDKIKIMIYSDCHWTTREMLGTKYYCHYCFKSLQKLGMAKKLNT